MYRSNQKSKYFVTIFFTVFALALGSACTNAKKPDVKAKKKITAPVVTQSAAGGSSSTAGEAQTAPAREDGFGDRQPGVNGANQPSDSTGGANGRSLGAVRSLTDFIIEAKKSGAATNILIITSAPSSDKELVEAAQTSNFVLKTVAVTK